MWEKLRVVFTIPELRRKIFFTLALLLVYRVGWQIPLPIIDQGRMTAFFGSQNNTLGQIFQQVAVFSAAQLSQITIFGLGIMPYISASIIFQLLGSFCSSDRWPIPARPVLHPAGAALRASRLPRHRWRLHRHTSHPGGSRYLR